MLELTNDNFQAEVLDASETVLVDFYADWCGPCQAMLPAVEDFAKAAPEGVKVAKLNIEEAGPIAEKYGVMSIPAFLVFKNGEVAKEEVGGGKTAEDLAAMVS